MSSYEFNKYNPLFEETPDNSDGSEFIREPAKWVMRNLREEHRALWLRGKIANPHWSREDVLAYALVGTDYAAAYLSDDIENIANEKLSLMNAITVRPPGTAEINCVKHTDTTISEGAACPDCVGHMLTLRPEGMTEGEAMEHINQLISSSIRALEMSPDEQVH